MSSLSDAMRLQKKLDVLSSMVQAAKDFSTEISETYHVELQHSDTKFVNHLLEVASQEIDKLVHEAERNNPSLQRTISAESNYSDGAKLQRKRAESAAQREKVHDLQEIRERLAKVLHYRAPSRSLSSAKSPKTKGGVNGTN